MQVQQSECLVQASFIGLLDIAKADVECSVNPQSCPTDEPVSSLNDLESDEYIAVQPVPTAEREANNVDFIDVERDEVVSILNDSDHNTYIFVVHVNDGKLFIGKATNQAALDKQLKQGALTEGTNQYQINQDIAPIILPNKNKLDLAKYACLLGTKYGWHNIVYSQQQFEEIRSCHRGIYKSDKKQEEEAGCRKKKLIFKPKEQCSRFTFVSKLRGVASVIRRLVTRRA